MSGDYFQILVKRLVNALLKLKPLLTENNTLPDLINFFDGVGKGDLNLDFLPYHLFLDAAAAATARAGHNRSRNPSWNSIVFFGKA